MKVVVGSLSPIKIAATEEVFKSKDVQVVGAATESGVRLQPVGKEETQKGATNRARQAMKMEPDAQIGIGMENGMWEIEEDNKKKWVDAACIIVLLKKKEGEVEEVVIWSDHIDIPKDFPGGPNGEWSIHKDPHSIITEGKRPRKLFLSDALLQWKKTRTDLL
eukprot:TRINITY_DN4277_c0_g1_i1.p1 TRINITY_DN4277_c0_g1~~TRINITY_DN4277_c0_g1_i1.p1  ORF type:complete len:163 (+),score=59.62 TRINITY_DN4277_c0_g1_i1:104-592(+)